MKKILITIGLSALVAYNSFGSSATITINGGTMTNLYSFTPNSGSILVRQMVLSAASGTAVQQLQFVDTPTNLLVYVTQPYTNRISYATNYPVVYTNFYGVVQSNTWYQSVAGNTYTNYQLVDVTNSVPQQTNNYPVRFAVAIPTNTPAIVYNGINQYYDNGVWVTNSAANGSAVVTIIW